MSKKTALYDYHVAAGAKMTDFAGYQMPIQYTGIQEEHMAVRNSVGMFDVSHMGEFIVEGNEALAVLQKITTNDLSRTKVGQAQYTTMTNEKGGIIDDLIIYRMNKHKYMMVVNASNIRKDWDWLIENKPRDCYTENISESIGLIALQGPDATNILDKITKENIRNIPFYHFSVGKVANTENVIISNTGYTGSGGFELYVENEYLGEVWEAIVKAAEEYELALAGLGARDTLRMEMGYCLYGNDIDENTTPLEAGLGWITKLKSKDSFIGKEALVKQKSKGVVNTLIGFELGGRRVARSGFVICNRAQKEIGAVSSGTYSPCLQKPIGLGYVPVNYVKNNKEILVSNGKKYFEGRIVKPPFINVKNYGSGN